MVEGHAEFVRERMQLVNELGTAEELGDGDVEAGREMGAGRGQGDRSSRANVDLPAPGGPFNRINLGTGRVMARRRSAEIRQFGT